MKTFKHGCRTNTTDYVLTNRDAIALMLAKNGPMSLKDLRDAMMRWRFGKATYKTKTLRRVAFEKLHHGAFEGEKHIVVQKIKRPTMSFSMYFTFDDTCSHLGKSFAASANNVYSSYHSIGPSMGRYVRFKRTPYWFRLCKGHYAITAAGLERLLSHGLISKT